MTAAELYATGLAMIQKGRRRDAVRAFARAAELDPNAVPPLLRAAELYQELDDLTAARQAYERALERLRQRGHAAQIAAVERLLASLPAQRAKGSPGHIWRSLTGRFQLRKSG